MDTNLTSTESSAASLQLAVYESTPITAWDFAEIKGQLERALSSFSNIIYTDDSIQSAKDDRSRLKKVKDVFEAARKDYKKQCMVPYEAVETKVKELTGLLDAQIAAVDAAVKEYEARMKAEKETAIRAYYDKKAEPLGALARLLYEKLFDQKWLNASTPRSTYEKEIVLKINAALQDVNAIRALNSPYETTLLEFYGETASLEAVKEKDAELRTAAEKAGFSKEVSVQPAPTEPEPQAAAGTDGVTLLALKASGWQLTRVKDFLTALGIEFEIR